MSLPRWVSFSESELSTAFAEMRLSHQDGEDPQQQELRRSRQFEYGLPGPRGESPILPDEYSSEFQEPAGQQDDLGNNTTRIRMGTGRTPFIALTTPVPTGYTIESLRMEYNEAARMWRQCNCRALTTTAITLFLAATPSWKCDFAICMGLGSLSRGHSAQRKLQMFLLAAFLEILLQLPPAGTLMASVPTFVQATAPLLTRLDKEFLATLDVGIYEELPHEDPVEYTVGGPVVERTLGRGSFIFKLFRDGVVEYMRKIQQIDPGLLITSVYASEVLDNIIQLRDILRRSEGRDLQSMTIKAVAAGLSGIEGEQTFRRLKFNIKRALEMSGGHSYGRTGDLETLAELDEDIDSMLQIREFTNTYHMIDFVPLDIGKEKASKDESALRFKLLFKNPEEVDVERRVESD